MLWPNKRRSKTPQPSWQCALHSCLARSDVSQCLCGCERGREGCGNSAALDSSMGGIRQHGGVPGASASLHAVDTDTSGVRERLAPRGMMGQAGLLGQAREQAATTRKKTGKARARRPHSHPRLAATAQTQAREHFSTDLPRTPPGPLTPLTPHPPTPRPPPPLFRLAQAFARLGGRVTERLLVGCVRRARCVTGDGGDVTISSMCRCSPTSCARCWERSMWTQSDRVLASGPSP